jgi:hypothetical protein
MVFHGELAEGGLQAHLVAAALYTQSFVIITHGIVAGLGGSP